MISNRIELRGNDSECIFHNTLWLVSKPQPRIFTQEPHTHGEIGNMPAGLKNTRPGRSGENFKRGERASNGSKYEI